jgi:hypothetical protein
MTLVLTWLFPEGIVMGADSAVTQHASTPSGRRIPRILTGLRKVYHIPKINAGISCWGKGRIGNYPVDVWLPDFIDSHENEYDTIYDFAILLQDELRELVPELSAPEGSREYRYGNRGFHLAGFVEYQGRTVPTFYHIHNGQSETYPNINPRIINANHDLPPQRVLELFSQRRIPHVRNGDFILYTQIFDRLYQLFNQFPNRLRFPDPTKFESPLSAYSEFVRFWIRLVRDIYALSNLPEIIGGEISVLSIAPTGETSFSSRP